MKTAIAKLGASIKRCVRALHVRTRGLLEWKPLSRRGPAFDPGEHFSPQRVASYREYKERQTRMAQEFQRRAAVESSLAAAPEAFSTPGYCFVCRRHVHFRSDLSHGFAGADGRITPNWREHLVCPVCTLNNRRRAAVHFFIHRCRPAAQSAIYLTEQATPVFRWLRKHYANLIGSEHLGSGIAAGGLDASGIRNESLTRLSFPDSVFDYVLSFDVFEHIPEYRTAFGECLRCLRPGGVLVFSVPFIHGSEDNIVRAEIDANGAVIHRLPPEYHADPVNPDGCLCFYHFGWSLLDELRALGYKDAAAYLYWSRELGYLGGDQLLFMASK